MKQKLYKITKEGLLETSPSLGFLKDSENDRFWLDLTINDRSELDPFFNGFLNDDLLSQIIDPDSSETLNSIDNFILLNLSIPNDKEFQKENFISIILKEGLLISILDNDNSLLSNLSDQINSGLLEQNLNLPLVIYYLLSNILYHSSNSLKKAREEVDGLLLQLDKDPNEVPLSEITTTKHSIYALANIIEDQYTTLVLIPKIKWEKGNEEVYEEIAKKVDRFDSLQTSMHRIEEKTKELQLHYQLILQEKGNKKLNMLTIIQSVFVPLTLISGIYGMNFVEMPELKWANGYYLVLVVMVLIVVFELILFKKKGWFD